MSSCGHTNARERIGEGSVGSSPCCEPHGGILVDRDTTSAEIDAGLELGSTRTGSDRAAVMVPARCGWMLGKGPIADRRGPPVSGSGRSGRAGSA